MKEDQEENAQKRLEREHTSFETLCREFTSAGWIKNWNVTEDYWMGLSRRQDQFEWRRVEQALFGAGDGI